jgi:superfamily I DNA/RNA helicase
VEITALQIPTAGEACQKRRQGRRCRCRQSTDKIETTVGRISIGSMHLAKSSEFRAVAVMACDEEVNPLQGADRIRDAA